uniref:endonuclease 8-like 2 isoform X1 n=3 Tax=Myxine glutinosa TaxID=7769 RepID=UPI00358F70C7
MHTIKILFFLFFFVKLFGEIIISTLPSAVMPEGPSLRRWQELVVDYWGGRVERVAGSTKQIASRSLVGRMLRSSQVHGKRLFIEFETSEATPLSEASQSLKSVLQATSDRSSEQTEVEKSDCGDVASGTTSGREGEEMASVVGVVRRGGSHWLQFHFGMYGSVRRDSLARATRANKRGDWKDPSPRLVLHFGASKLLAFYNCRIIWLQGEPRLAPATDILSTDFDPRRAATVLARPAPVAHTLLNQNCFAGLGNIIKNEALFAAKVNPLSFGSALPQSRIFSLVQEVLRIAQTWKDGMDAGTGLQGFYQVYKRSHCPLGHQLLREDLGPQHCLQRPTWWCPDCQPLVSIRPNLVQEELHQGARNPPSTPYGKTT